VNFYCSDFWGQATDRRIRYVAKLLMKVFKKRKMLKRIDLSIAYQ